MPRIPGISSLRGPGIAMVAAIAAFTLGGSCYLGTTTTHCDETGLRCRQGQECAASQAVCIDIGGCGNSRIDEGEVCDDGNIIDGDDCSADCKSNETCGNFIVDLAVGETCDDGNRVSNDHCDANCHEELCSNLRIDPGEACDDGNTASGDGCRADCRSNEACGNGMLDDHLGEQCEFPGPPFPFPGPIPDTPACDSDCTIPMCGDGHTNPTFVVVDQGPDHVEQCDPGIIVNGVTLDTPGCDSDCTFVACGDGHTNRSMVNGIALEECESGGIDTVDCDRDCTRPKCGDNHTNPAKHEQCDPGGGDLPPDTASCDSDCTLPVCGDGHVNPARFEECDPGMMGMDSSTCDGDCSRVVCGDGHRNAAAGELCDPDVVNGQTGCPLGTICRKSDPPDPARDCMECN